MLVCVADFSLGRWGIEQPGLAFSIRLGRIANAILRLFSSGDLFPVEILEIGDRDRNLLLQKILTSLKNVIRKIYFTDGWF
ncbi:hypothetical protein [Geitlerinema sp. PCC 9228]|jgi:hypothetical protein|uniref:hypothetical protein n=1 Tax=Geitlerinema sp. PCC 9228 TaxID=111611 RepID=UPI0008F9C20F|nr:hypothetical protein [Geitlerinema sp. PCC 9228]